MFKVKKVGRHWLIRPLGGQFSRLRLPVDTETVELSDNFLIVNDIVYEITSSGNDVFLEKLPDVCLGQDSLSVAEYASVIPGAENIIKEMSEITQQPSYGADNIQQEMSGMTHQPSSEKFNAEKNDGASEQQEIIDLEASKSNKLYPLTIIFETENNQANQASSGNVPIDCTGTVNKVIVSDSESNDSQGVMLEDRVSEVKIETDIYKEESPITSSEISSGQKDTTKSSAIDSNEVEDKTELNEMEALYMENDCLEASRSQETDEKERVEGTLEVQSRHNRDISKHGNKQEQHIFHSEEHQQHRAFEEDRAISTNQVSLSLFNVKKGGSCGLDSRHSAQWSTSDGDLVNESDANTKRKSDYFVTEVIEIVHREIITVLKNRYKKKFDEIIGDAEIDISFSQSSVMISAKCVTGHQSAIKMVRNFVESLSSRNILQLPVKDEFRIKIQSICTEIENVVGYYCCTFLASYNMVVVYCKTYEETLMVKHLFKFKTGEIRRTGTRREMNTDILTTSLPMKDEEKSKCRKCPASIIVKYDWSNKTKKLKAFLLPNSIIVKVYEGNILDVPVDCIVNASNEKLIHGGGIARVIAQAAGLALELEGQAYIKKYGCLQTGTVCKTTAGDLPYRCVIHAVGPIWHQYTPHAETNIKMCEDDLLSAILESLCEAEKSGGKSVAIPSVSSGIFGVPVPLCVCMYVRATIQYCLNACKNSLVEIHFVDINPSMVKSIQNEFQTVVCDKGKSSYNRGRYVK